jgi:hypothetical protein
MNSCTPLDNAIGQLVTKWVLHGGKGAFPNREGASLDTYWMVAVYEQLMKSKRAV